MDLYLKQYLASVKATRATNTYTTYCNAFKNWFSDGKVNLELDFINSKLQQWDCSVKSLQVGLWTKSGVMNRHI